MKAIILLSLVCLANIVELVQANKHSNLHEWTHYKRQYGKIYETPEEDAQRFSLFLASKEFIRQHNANDQATFKMGLNHMSDWAPNERVMLRGRVRRRPNEQTRLSSNESKIDLFLEEEILANPAPVPVELDWRRVHDRVSAVGQQGDCGSDWAFAAAGVLEGQQVVRKFSEKLIPLSKQQLVECINDGYGCIAGYLDDALDDIVQMGGIMSEEDYPYVGFNERAGGCAFNESKSVMINLGHIDLPLNNDKVLKETVAKYGPVATLISPSDELHHYRSGIFTDSSHLCREDLDLAVLIVGYGTDPSDGDYWIVKNSWSSAWGEDGYFRIRPGTCGIGQESYIAKF
uniref:Cathepsin K n=1 Tax=Aceria tosichella TaxID=561515 RepID=A0A6G1SE06_9ACAR